MQTDMPAESGKIKIKARKSEVYKIKIHSSGPGQAKTAWELTGGVKTKK